MAIDIKQCENPPRTEWWLIWIAKEGWLTGTEVDSYGCVKTNTSACPQLAQEFNSYKIAKGVIDKFNILDADVYRFCAGKQIRDDKN